MKVENWPIDQVKPYENNPRNNDDAVDATAQSIKEFGWQQPIVVDKDGVIIVGHTRLRAAKQLSMDKVPVVVAADLSPEKVKAYRLADNKTSDLAVWDNKKLLEELDSLGDDTFTGFDQSEIFDEVLDETDNTVIDDNEAGVTYGLSYKTQNKAVFDKIVAMINEESMVNGE